MLDAGEHHKGLTVEAIRLHLWQCCRQLHRLQIQLIWFCVVSLILIIRYSITITFYVGYIITWIIYIHLIILAYVSCWYLWNPWVHMCVPVFVCVYANILIELKEYLFIEHRLEIKFLMFIQVVLNKLLCVKAWATFLASLSTIFFVCKAERFWAGLLTCVGAHITIHLSLVPVMDFLFNLCSEVFQSSFLQSFHHILLLLPFRMQHFTSKPLIAASWNLRWVTIEISLSIIL